MIDGVKPCGKKWRGYKMRPSNLRIGLTTIVINIFSVYNGAMQVLELGLGDEIPPEVKWANRGKACTAAVVYTAIGIPVGSLIAGATEHIFK